MLNKTTGNEEFNRLVLDTIASLVAVLDRAGRIISFNHTCEEITGYTFEEVKNRLVWDFLIPSEQVDAVRDVFLKLQAGDFPSKYENHWMTKSGSRRLIAWSNDCLQTNGRLASTGF